MTCLWRDGLGPHFGQTVSLPFNPRRPWQTPPGRSEALRYQHHDGAREARFCPHTGPFPRITELSRPSPRALTRLRKVKCDTFRRLALRPVENNPIFQSMQDTGCDSCFSCQQLQPKKNEQICLERLFDPLVFSKLCAEIDTKASRKIISTFASYTRLQFLAAKALRYSDKWTST